MRKMSLGNELEIIPFVWSAHDRGVIRRDEEDRLESGEF